jgi:hypothetical protein
MTQASDLYAERLQRIKKAVALEKPDRVPVVPLGDSFAAKLVGEKLTVFCSGRPEDANKTMIRAFTSLGEIDGIQHASFDANMLSTIWLSKVKMPGQELPEDSLWQVEEQELMSPDDYDVIISKGWQEFVGDFWLNRLDNLGQRVQPFFASIPAAMQAWADLGIVPFSPVIVTIPYEYFCGARSMREFVKDLFRRPDKVQEAMDVVIPDLVEQARQLARGLKVHAMWVGGWRAASEFLSRPLWERFVFPYYKKIVEAVVEEGVIPVLHWDSNWTRDLEYLLDFPKARCVFSPDGATDIFKAKKVLGDHMCIMGDVPSEMLALATPDRVTEYCKRLIGEIGPAGFILAQGCDIPPNAKPENVRALIASVHQ